MAVVVVIVVGGGGGKGEKPEDWMVCLHCKVKGTQENDMTQNYNTIALVFSYKYHRSNKVIWIGV